MRGQRHVPAALYPRERPSTYCTGGWVGPTAGVDKCGKSRPSPRFDSRTVQPVASRYTDYSTRPTELILDPLYIFCCVIRRLLCLGYQRVRSVLSLKTDPRDLFLCHKNKLTLRRLMPYIYMEHPFLMFLDHTQRRSTVGRTPLDE